MFLIPAFVALVADSLVVYLHRSLLHDAVRLGNDSMQSQSQQQQQQQLLQSNSETWDEQDKAIYKVGYLTLFAWIRILVLFLPLLFHSYTGTALPCHSVYILWYSITLCLVVAHMLALALLNPESMEALVPEPEGFLENLHFYRRLWYTLLLSMVSNLAHFALIQHVKSSAPTTRTGLFYTNSATASSITGTAGTKRHKPPVSLFFAIRAHPVLQDEPALLQAMNEFVVDMQARLQRTQQEWTKRLEDFSLRYNPRSAAGGGVAGGVGVAGAMGTSHQPFQVLLQLFAYQDVFTGGQLDAVWQADGGRAVSFLVPQLLSFLLHGAASQCSKQLEDWILEACRENITFAHRCFWFLRAWCLEVPLLVNGTLSRTNSEGQLSRSSFSSSVASPASGGGLIPFLDEPAAADVNHHPFVNNVCGDSVSRFMVASGPSPEDDKFLPEERMIIEHFMLRVKECGQEAAWAFMVGGGGSKSSGSDDTMDDGFHEDSMMLNRQASLPVHPRTGVVSTRHLQSVTSPRRYGFLPLAYAQQCRNQRKTMASPLNQTITDAFDETPRFWDALIHLADSLFEVNRKERKTELRQALQMLECEILPHNAIYVPLHHVPHRVWRILAEESIPLGTKERVPCIVTLEVVQKVDDNGQTPSSFSGHSSDSLLGGNGSTGQRDTNGYSHRRTRRKSSLMQLLDHLPRSLGRASSAQSQALESGLASMDASDNQSMDEDEQQHHLQYPSHHPDMDEDEIIQEWRFKPRHPLRRVPFISKVADSMKGGLKRVGVTVRERLERDRTVSEELQALTLAESLVSPSSLSSDADAGEAERRRRRKTVRRHGESEPSVRVADKGHDSLMDRANSGNSLESMGQWETPKPSRPAVTSRISPELNAVRRRIDRNVVSADDIKSSNNNNNNSGLLVYGSDHEEDIEKGYHGLTVPTLAHDAETPKKGSVENTRPPPVVFRESWQAKQERIRRDSAYGQHPGWRLLPVLIKANDDLRQEQMASQLIYKMASILARERCPVWLCPYEIIALTDSGGIIEAIPDTISLDSLKRNDPNFTTLRDFFHSYYGEDTTALANAKANFVESLAAYSMVCFLLQIKDRHNGNILLDSQGHLVHIDFGFFFLSSPGKNAGFESAPFKLTREFVDLLDGPKSHLFHVFRELCVRSFLALRKHCMEIILLVEMLKSGNEHLKCFRGRPDNAIAQLRERFRLDLNDRACREYVYSLIDNSIENWRTDWYDRYQRYFVGVL